MVVVWVDGMDVKLVGWSVVEMVAMKAFVMAAW